MAYIGISFQKSALLQKDIHIYAITLEEHGSGRALGALGGLGGGVLAKKIIIYRRFQKSPNSDITGAFVAMGGKVGEKDAPI